MSTLTGWSIPNVPGCCTTCFSPSSLWGPSLTSLVARLAIQSPPGKAVSGEDLLGLVYVTGFGMLPGVVFAKTTSLLPSLFLHAVNNFSL